MVSVTSARPSGGREEVPAKTTSSILPPRRGLTPCSPMTQERASTTFDLPDPFGPTTQVMPGSNRKVVAEAKDLNPRRVRVFRYTCWLSSSSGRRLSGTPSRERAADRFSRPYRDQAGFPCLTRRWGRNEGAAKSPPSHPGPPQATLRDAAMRRPLSDVTCVRDVSGEHGFAFAAGDNEFVADAGRKHVVRLLQPGQLGLQVVHPLLEAAHFREHAGIRPADVAENSLRHCSGSSTLSDQSGRTREETHRCAQGDLSRIAPSRVSGQVERSRRSKATGAAGPGGGGAAGRLGNCRRTGS